MNDAVILANDRIRLEIWPLGARLNQLYFDDIPCLVSAPDYDEALSVKSYNGAIIGPVANRIAGGNVVIADKKYEMMKNEHGQTALHSGLLGAHALEWHLQSTDARAATWTIQLRDGHCGLPGQRTLTAEYVITENGFTLELSARSDVITIMNLAFHPYWSLGAARDILEIKVNADRYTPVNELKIPTGEILDVVGTSFDLRTLATPSAEIDHNFCLSHETDDPAFVLRSPQIQLDAITDAPGLQVYTGKTTGIAIEPQLWPDAPHHPGFPSILLHPGETFRQTTCYRFQRL